jgi:G:T-mismatch repair DNA endonuclease (very short patch repair protein)
LLKHKNEVKNLCNAFNGELNKQYSPIVDILLENNIIIEMYGDYWHANPIFYKDNDIFYTWEGPQFAKEIWQKDLIRKHHIEMFNYKVIIIWENELKDSNKLKIKIMEFLNENC